MTDLITELKNLCEINGISGDEGRVRDYIISRIKDRCEYYVDPLGSLIARAKGRSDDDSHVIMVNAHMDEVGFIVTYITPEGYLKIAPVGGIDRRVAFGRRVQVGDSGLVGVIGGKAMHHLSSEERKQAPDFGEMYVDIGAQSCEEAAALVTLGDSVCFVSEFERFGSGFIKGKAIDDRVGCAIMIKLICDEELRQNTDFAFVVQEEIGLRGSAAAAYSIYPDDAYVLEATTAADIPSASGEKRVCELGKGPVVSFMDRRTIYNKHMYQNAFLTANDLGIPCQTKTMVAGGNDAGSIQTARGGARVCGISLPCRYLHSPACVIHEDDLENTYKLIRELLVRGQR